MRDAKNVTAAAFRQNWFLGPLNTLKKFKKKLA
jgi:hypothetical protein